MNAKIETMRGKLYNRIEIELSETTLSAYITGVMAAIAKGLPVGTRYLAAFAEQSDVMSIRSLTLAAGIAAGLKLYSLTGCGDRALAKFALRQLSMNGGIYVEVIDDVASIEVFRADGTAATQKEMQMIDSAMTSIEPAWLAAEKFMAPVRIRDFERLYFQDLVITTTSRHLRYNVIVCCRQKQLYTYFQSVGAAFGISFLFVNEPCFVPELILQNALDFGLYIDSNGDYILYDENGTKMSRESFYALLVFMAASALPYSTVYVPKEEVSETIQAVAEACHVEVFSAKQEDFEARLLRTRQAVTRLEHDLCFDPIRCLIRVCEFLYINNMTLAQIGACLSSI